MNKNALKSILAPITVEDFFDAYWLKTPLYVVEDRNFDSILTIEEINNYFERLSLIYPHVRVVGNGSEFDFKQYRLDYSDTFNFINKQKLFDLFNSGNTLVIQAAQFQFQNLNCFVQELEKNLEMDVNANIYITPSNAQGFHPHFDTHDVFVIQIYGEKKWNIYDIPIELPIAGFGMTAEERKKYLESAPAHKVSLSQGDFLYVPRGVVHDAFCEQQPSIHITFGIKDILNIDVLKKIGSKAENSVFFREYLKQKKLKPSVDEIRTAMVSQLDGLLKELLEKSYEKATPSSDKYKNTKDLFHQLLAADSIEHDDEIQEFDIFGSEESINNFDNSFLNAEVSISSLDDVLKFLQNPNNDFGNKKMLIKKLVLNRMISIS